MTENQRKTLGKGPFHAVIDSELKDGSLTYGEIVLPGESEQEIFLSTYICHPSMANNELSGPCVLIYLAKILSEIPHRRYTYRMIFIPETIGAITYHTSLDNLSLISETGLSGALEVYWKCLMGLEHNYYYCVTCLCEPQLGKRGLYPTLSRKGSYHDIRAMTNFIAYADGSNDLFDISNMIRVPTERLIKIADTLQTAGLLERGETKKNCIKQKGKTI